MAREHNESALLLSPDEREIDPAASDNVDDSGTGTSALFAGLVEPVSGELIATHGGPESGITSISKKQIWLMAPALALGIALMTADAAVEFASYFQIGSAFNELRHVSWLTLTYIMTVTVSQPLYSRLSDIYGRKPILLFSYAAFGLGIAMCTLSFNFWGLVLSRGVVGSGSGGMGYMVTVILNDIIPLRQRALWQSGVQMSVLVGQVIGGILGSLVVDKLGWRLAFLLELPLAPVLLIWGTYIIRLPRPILQSYHKDVGTGPQKHLQAGLFDLTGTGLLVLALMFLVLALNLAGNDLPWNHPVIPALFFISALFFAVFVWVELKFSRVPLVPIQVLVSTEIISVMATVFFTTGLLAALMYAVPYYINVSGRGTANLGGIMNVLLVIGQTVGQSMCGAFITWKGRPWNVLIVAVVTSLLSAIWIRSRWSNSESFWENVSPVLLIGLSIGATMGALLVCLLKSTKKADRAIMYGSFHIFSSTASMATISCVSAIVRNQFIKYLRRNFGKEFHVDVDKLAKECMKSLQCLDPFPESVQENIRKSFVLAMSDSFNLLWGVALLAVVAALTVKKFRVDYHDQ